MTVETPAGTDRAAIEETIEHYFAAVSHNDPEALRLRVPSRLRDAVRCRRALS